MKDLLGNFNVLDILRVGLSGLIFLLSYFSYRLIVKEQERPTSPRKGILRTIYIFMGINAFSAVLVALAGYFQPAQFADVTKQNQRYRVLMSELASTIDTKVEYEATQREGPGNAATLKPSVNALLKTIKAARKEGLVGE